MILTLRPERCPDKAVLFAGRTGRFARPGGASRALSVRLAATPAISPSLQSVTTDFAYPACPQSV
eukprot:6201127-Pleurochrysis_carterae.AAC.1